jgi:hypothetical protein
MPILHDCMNDDCERQVQELLSLRNMSQNQLLATATNPHNKLHDHNSYRSTNIKLQITVTINSNPTDILQPEVATENVINKNCDKGINTESMKAPAYITPNKRGRVDLP